MASKKIARASLRETIIIAALYALFFAWWYATAYGFGDDPSKYRYVLGFPEWFFYSCIVGYVAIAVILTVAVRYFFAEIPLEEEENVELENERLD